MYRPVCKVLSLYGWRLQELPNVDIAGCRGDSCALVVFCNVMLQYARRACAQFNDSNVVVGRSVVDISPSHPRLLTIPLFWDARIVLREEHKSELRIFLFAHDLCVIYPSCTIRISFRNVAGSRNHEATGFLVWTLTCEP